MSPTPRTMRLASVSACLLAPLALLRPWALVPGHLGIATAGWTYFRSWLTKAPNLGPINWQVGAGILCVVLSSLLPALFAAYFVLARAPKPRALLLAALAQLVVYLPVLVRLDMDMLIASLRPTEGAFSDGINLWTCAGAPLRVAATLSMCVLAGLRRRG